MPVRSVRYATDCPSGAHCGLMFKPAWFGSTDTFPLSTSRSAIFIFPTFRMPKSVSSPRSLAKAMVLPSGDHCGCRSPYASLVSCWRPGWSSETV